MWMSLQLCGWLTIMWMALQLCGWLYSYVDIFTYNYVDIFTVMWIYLQPCGHIYNYVDILVTLCAYLQLCAFDACKVFGTENRKACLVIIWRYLLIL